MFKTLSPKGAATRDRIRDAALARFRRDGPEAATMRDIADDADVALGAAYHYFPGKDAIILAYYDQVQALHTQRVTAGMPHLRALRARLDLVFQTKYDILEHDRKLMGGLLGYTGHADHPLSFLGRETRSLREQSVALFALALKDEPLPKDLVELAPLAFWALHMVILLYSLYDTSPRLARTRQLTDRALDAAVRTLAIVKLPLFRPLRRRVIAMLGDAGIRIAPAQEAA